MYWLAICVSHQPPYLTSSRIKMLTHVWHSVIELQALTVEAIEHFKFALPKGVEIMRLPAGIMVPMVKGKMHEGTQMPLHVSLAEE